MVVQSIWIVGMNKLYKSWPVHNLIAHPLSEIVWWVTRNEGITGWIHDITLPDHEPGTGRG